MNIQTDKKETEETNEVKPLPCTCGCESEGDCVHEFNRKQYDKLYSNPELFRSLINVMGGDGFGW